MSESTYEAPQTHGARLDHGYGPNVHIVADPWSLALLARLGHPDTNTPELHQLLQSCYRVLLHAASEQLPRRRVDVPTRMAAKEPTARFAGTIIDAESRAVIIDIARAGMVPSHLFQQMLFDVVHPRQVRVDHVFSDRVTDPVTGAVTGVAFHGSKIGGDVDGATLFVPDPMGATGRSLLAALDHYDRHVAGTPRKIVVCHLIVTPEYLWRVTRARPHLSVYALRLDRGLSAADVLATRPGDRWSDERGLDAHDYIVPGAGGIGELLNNAT
jgi:uracil phosphoribosyltransferase